MVGILEPRLEPYPPLRAFACAASPPCPQQWGANLTIPARLCAQEASSRYMLTIPNGRVHPRLMKVRPAARSVRLGLHPARAAHQCLPAAGPRATFCTVGDAHFVRTLPEVSTRARVYAVIFVLALARSLGL